MQYTNHSQEEKVEKTVQVFLQIDGTFVRMDRFIGKNERRQESGNTEVAADDGRTTIVCRKRKANKPTETMMMGTSSVPRSERDWLTHTNDHIKRAKRGFCNLENFFFLSPFLFVYFRWAGKRNIHIHAHIYKLFSCICSFFMFSNVLDTYLCMCSFSLWNAHLDIL